MNKVEYRKARRLFRDNGKAGLKFIRSISEKVSQEFYDYYWDVYLAKDKLKDRADVVAWCNREGYSYNFKQVQ